MDPLTHAVVGAIAAETLAPRSTEAWALVASAGAAVLPDIDFVTRRLGHLGLLRFHGTVTHSLVGVTVLAALWGAAVAAVSGLEWTVLAGFALLGGLSHVALDLTIHQKGLALFWPFSWRPVRSGLFVGLNTRASTRCGEHRAIVCASCQARTVGRSPFFLLSAATAVASVAGWPWRREIAIAGGAALLAFTLIQLWLRSRARRLAAAALGDGASVHPASYDGTKWLAARPAGDGWTTTLVDLRTGKSAPPVVHRPASRERVEQTRGREAVATVTERSVIPFAEAAPDGRGIWWRDLSYAHDPAIDLFVLKIDFDPQGEVCREEFRERW